MSKKPVEFVTQTPANSCTLFHPDFEFQFPEIHEQIRDLKTLVSETIADSTLRNLVLERLKLVQLDLLDYSISDPTP